MKIFITGGTGFIGRSLVAQLATQHELVILSRQKNFNYQSIGGKVTLINTLDQRDNLNDIDAVINLAGEPIVTKRWSQLRKQQLRDSRLLLTKRVVELIKNSTNPPKLLLNASAIGWYGSQDTRPLDEHFTEPHDEFIHQLCQQWEALANEASSPHTRVCIMRIGLVLGADGGMLAKMAPIYRWGLGGAMGSGQQIMSWIHKQDLISALLFLLNNEQCHGIYNGTAPTPVSNREFSKTLAQTLHRPHLFPIPAFLLRMIMGESATLLLTGQYVLPTRLQQAGFDFNYPTLAGALTNIFHQKT